MLLPPDSRDWVAENDLVHLVMEAVELCDLSGAQLERAWQRQPAVSSEPDDGAVD